MSFVSSVGVNITKSNFDVTASEEKTEIEQSTQGCFDNTIKNSSEVPAKKKKKRKKKAKNITNATNTDDLKRVYFTFNIEFSTSQDWSFKVPLILFDRSVRRLFNNAQSQLSISAPTETDVARLKRWKQLNPNCFIIEVRAIEPPELNGMTLTEYLTVSRIPLGQLILSAITSEKNRQEEERNELIDCEEERNELIDCVDMDPTVGEQLVSYKVLPLSLNEIKSFISHKRLSKSKEENNKVFSSYNAFAAEIASICVKHKVLPDCTPSSIFGSISFQILQKYFPNDKDKKIFYKFLNPIFNLNHTFTMTLNFWKKTRMLEDDFHFSRKEAEEFFQKQSNQSIFNESLQEIISNLNSYLFNENINKPPKSLNSKAVTNACKDLKKLYAPLYELLKFLVSITNNENRTTAVFNVTKLFEKPLSASFICRLASFDNKDQMKSWLLSDIEKFDFIAGDYFIYERYKDDLALICHGISTANYRSALLGINDLKSQVAVNLQNDNKIPNQVKFELLSSVAKLDRLMRRFYSKENSTPLIDSNLKKLENANKSLALFSNATSLKNINPSFRNWLTNLGDDNPLVSSILQLDYYTGAFQILIKSSVEFNNEIVGMITTYCEEEELKLLQSCLYKNKKQKEYNTWDQFLNLVKSEKITTSLYGQLWGWSQNVFYVPIEKEFVQLIEEMNEKLKCVQDLTFVQYLSDLNSPNLPTIEQIKEAFIVINEHFKALTMPLFAFLQTNHDLFRDKAAPTRDAWELISSFPGDPLKLQTLETKVKVFNKFERELQRYKIQAETSTNEIMIETYDESVELTEDLLEVVPEIKPEPQAEPPKVSQIESEPKKEVAKSSEVKNEPTKPTPKASSRRKKKKKPVTHEDEIKQAFKGKTRKIYKSWNQLFKNVKEWGSKAGGNGSHRILIVNGRRISLPNHREIKKGTLHGIKKKVNTVMA